MILNDKSPPITGIRIILAKFEINDDKNNEKELYVTASVGFLVATIIDVIIGK